MENYEVMVLLDVNLPEDERRDIANEIEKDIIDLGGEVESNTQYDVRELAFPIEGVTRADYRLIEYKTEKSGPTNDELRERLNFHDDVVRYLIVNQNKDRHPDREVFESAEEDEDVEPEPETESAETSTDSGEEATEEETEEEAEKDAETTEAT